MIKEVLPGKEWNKLIAESINVDFYFLNGYQSLSDNDGQPILLYYEEFGSKILFPVLKRAISGTDLFDLTSVYGYAGPLYIQNKLGAIKDNFFELFKENFRKYCSENKVVSCFSRLHPLFPQDEILAGIGEITTLSQTVSINLLDAPELQRKQFRKGVKSDLSRLRKRNLEVFEDVDYNHVNDFIEIYNENMKRVDAKPSYFFPKEYYSKLFNSNDMDARLFFIKDDGKLIAGSIFVFTNDIIQYHLSGTRSNALQNSPVRLLIDYVRLLGTELKYKYLHLGGGVGGVEDSLFSFKAGFSKNRNSFKVWSFISDITEYDNLVRKFGKDSDSSMGFFPAYRQ